MNRGYRWREFRNACLDDRIQVVVKRRIPLPTERAAFECCVCGSIFKRKHVRYSDGTGWICRDRCERKHKGLP
jgi:hypothetical protein